MSLDYIDIFRIEELKRIIKRKILKGSIVLRSDDIYNFEGISSVDGSVGICTNTLNSLNDLCEINGDLWISTNQTESELTSLGSLRVVKGNVRLRFSNIQDLGGLEHVGGNLILRDTKIQSLGQVKFIGGNLFLPQRMKNTVDLSEITVSGNIRFWNDDTRNFADSEKPLEFQSSELIVPFWPERYIYSHREILSCNNKQKEFYEYFRSAFLQSNVIDVKSNNNYVFTLYYDLIDNYKQDHIDIHTLARHLTTLSEYYTITRAYAQEFLVREFECLGLYEESWELIKKNQYQNLKSYWDYEQIFQRSLIDASLVCSCGISHLTSFGQKNIEIVKNYILTSIQEYENNAGTSFFHNFFSRDQYFKEIDGQYSPEYYRKFFLNDEDFEEYYSYDTKNEKTGYSRDIRFVVEHAVNNQLRVILRNAEQICRRELGLPLIGEGWISETELYYKIKDQFPECSIVHHGSPKWLGRQHFDIYFPNENIAIEYQGLQHYQPVEFFGGIEGFEKAKERDEKKKKLAEANGCTLLYFDESSNYNDLIEVIKKKLLSSGV
jgi:hypothetical protein